MAFLKRKPKTLPPSGKPTETDTNPVLLQLSPHAEDAWRLNDAFEGVAIFGATGSGKSSGSGKNLAHAYLSHGFGGLVLTSKPSDRADWERYCQQTGRSDDLVIFGPDQPHRFNVLQYEAERATRGGGLVENLVDLFVTLLQSGDSGNAGSNEAFWSLSVKQLLRASISLLIAAGEPLTVQAIDDVIATAPTSVEELGNKQWQSESFCLRCIEKANQNPSADLAVTEKFFLRSYPRMDSKTRANVQASLNVMADLLSRGVLRELFSTTVNITPEVTHDGKILLLDMPVKDFLHVGVLSQLLWKTVWQSATERRRIHPDTRPVFLWADEAQLFISKKAGGDEMFQATARSSRAATVYLSQSLSAYQNEMGHGRDGRIAAHTFIANLGTRIFHANSDITTNTFAEESIGKLWRYRGTSSISNQPDQKQGKMIRSTTGGVAPSLESQILASEFTMLTKGGPQANWTTEAIVFQTGRRWRASDTNYLRVRFNQS